MYPIKVNKVCLKGHPCIDSEVAAEIEGIILMAESISDPGILAFRRDASPVSVSASEVARVCFKKPQVVLNCMRNIREKGGCKYPVLFRGEYSYVSASAA